jgi:hypothetical protein
MYCTPFRILDPIIFHILKLSPKYCTPFRILDPIIFHILKLSTNYCTLGSFRLFLGLFDYRIISTFITFKYITAYVYMFGLI